MNNGQNEMHVLEKSQLPCVVLKYTGADAIGDFVHYFYFKCVISLKTAL